MVLWGKGGQKLVFRHFWREAPKEKNFDKESFLDTFDKKIHQFATDLESCPIENKSNTLMFIIFTSRVLILASLEVYRVFVYL